MTTQAESPTSSDNHDFVKLLMVVAVFWLLVGFGLWQARSTVTCALGMGADLTSRCADALKKPFVVGPLRAHIAKAQAVRLSEAEDYQGAINVSQDLVDTRYMTDTLHSLRARAFRALEQFDKATDEYKKAYALRPNSQIHFNDLVSHLRDRQDFAEGIKVTSEYASRHPESNFAFYWWGYLAEGSGDFAVAVEKYGTAIERDPNDQYSMKGRARSFAELKKYDEALAEYGKIIESGKSDSYATELRADLLQQLGRYKEAQSDYQSILDQEQQIHILISLANSYMGEKNFEAAKPLIDRALEFEADYVGAHMARVRFHLLQNQIDDAVAAVGVMEDYSEENAMHWQAKIDAKVGYLNGAIEGFTALLPIWPGDSEVRCDLGHALLDAKRKTEALAIFDEAVKLEPKRAEPYSGRARANLDLEKWTEAVRDASMALDVTPRDATALARRGIAYGKLKDFEKAQQDFTLAKTLVADEVWIAKAHVEMLLENKKLSEAAKTLTELEMRKPEPEILEDLKARLLQEQGDSVQ